MYLTETKSCLSIAETCQKSLWDGIDLMMSEMANYYDSSANKMGGLKYMSSDERTKLKAIVDALKALHADVMGSGRIAKLDALSTKLGVAL